MARASTTRRRALVAAALMPALLGLVPGTARAVTPEPRERIVPKRICPYEWKDSRRELKRLIRCAARHYGSPGGVDKALDVARCESRFDPDAYNPAGYGGVYQHALRYWPDRADRWGFPDRSVFNGRANVIVSIRMARSAGDWDLWGCG
jgi:hypothetical protein